MAEEQVETLQMELATLKERVEELTIDLEVFQHDREGSSFFLLFMVLCPMLVEKMYEDSPTSENQGVNSVEAAQLEKHNERLKEALVK